MAVRAEGSGPAGGAPGLERRAVGLPTAIGTTFGLIVASTVLVTVAQGFFASYVWIAALGSRPAGHVHAELELRGARHDDPEGRLDERVRASRLRAVLRHPDRPRRLHRRDALPDGGGGVHAGRRSSRASSGRAGPRPTFWVIIFVVFVALLNAAGIRPYAAVEVGLTGFIVVSLLILGIIGLAGARLERSDRRRVPRHPVRMGPLLDPARARDVHVRRDGVHVPARRGDREPRPEHPARDLPRPDARDAFRSSSSGLPSSVTCRPTSSAAFSPVAHMEAAIAILGRRRQMVDGDHLASPRPSRP